MLCESGTQVPIQIREVEHMKALLVSAFLMSSTITAVAADTPSVAGKWKIHQSIANNESDSVCTLTQTGTDVGGTCKGAEGPELKVTGKVEGTKVTWHYEAEYNGSPLTMTYTATLDSNSGKFAGTVDVDPFGVQGDFTATADK